MSNACLRCGQCCGLIPLTKKEWKHVKRYVAKHRITPVRQGMTCPFFQNNACVIYPVRPPICRMFGAIPEMPCPNGCNSRLPGTTIAALKRHIRETPDEIRLLHEFVMSEAEIGDMLASEALLTR